MRDKLILGFPFEAYSLEEIRNASPEDAIKMKRFNEERKSFVLSYGEAEERERKLKEFQRNREEKLQKEAFEAGRSEALKEEKKLEENVRLRVLEEIQRKEEEKKYQKEKEKRKVLLGELDRHFTYTENNFRSLSGLNIALRKKLKGFQRYRFGSLGTLNKEETELLKSFKKGDYFPITLNGDNRLLIQNMLKKSLGTQIQFLVKNGYGLEQTGMRPHSFKIEAISVSYTYKFENLSKILTKSEQFSVKEIITQLRNPYINKFIVTIDLIWQQESISEEAQNKIQKEIAKRDKLQKKIEDQKMLKAAKLRASAYAKEVFQKEQEAKKLANKTALQQIDFLVYSVSFFVAINLFILIGMEHSIRTMLLIPISGFYAMSAMLLKEFVTGNFGVVVFSILFWVAIIYAFTFKSMLISAAVISMFAIPHFFINLYIDKLIARKHLL